MYITRISYTAASCQRPIKYDCGNDYTPEDIPKIVDKYGTTEDRIELHDDDGKLRAVAWWDDKLRQYRWMTDKTAPGEYHFIFRRYK